MRDGCTLLRSDLPKEEGDKVRHVQFVHVSFSGSRELHKFKYYEYKVKLKLGKNPVVIDPALVVVEPKDFSVEQHQKNSAMLFTRLDPPCQTLYNDIMAWKFQDDDFPHLFEAIERSIRDKSGWCYQRLQQKSSRFGQSDTRATYLRIAIGKNQGRSPGVPYVLEIWPPGHYSPIHAHANTYGIIRVLYGDINVRFYSTLSLKRKVPFLEQTIFENQSTWLSPGLNQIHKLENKSSNKTCITIQAYEYQREEISHYEYFNYINNNGLSIDKFDPISDMEFGEFKKQMLTEWNSRV